MPMPALATHVGVAVLLAAWETGVGGPQRLSWQAVSKAAMPQQDPEALSSQTPPPLLALIDPPMRHCTAHHPKLGQLVSSQPSGRWAVPWAGEQASGWPPWLRGPARGPLSACFLKFEKKLRPRRLRVLVGGVPGRLGAEWRGPGVRGQEAETRRPAHTTMLVPSPHEGPAP